MEELWTGPGELPKQVSTDQGMGRSLYQGQGAHQQCVCHEALTLLQGNGGNKDLIWSKKFQKTHTQKNLMVVKVFGQVTTRFNTVLFKFDKKRHSSNTQVQYENYVHICL